MKIAPDKECSYYDIDKTLIDTEEVPEGTEGDMVIDFLGTYRVEPNYEMIEQLKKDKKDGRLVIVWHKGGTIWSRKVIKLLKLENYVDFIMPKPDTYYDDELPREILGTRGKLND